ncbi:uncharacterized protein LOC134206741 [Armigeres subalbatus]|uniref:uncharacterized protein LOC134206741 n=1 Tax=Armigeres subalbatus TaxID=124917 RepID=UPI002ED68D1E
MFNRLINRLNNNHPTRPASMNDPPIININQSSTLPSLYSHHSRKKRSCAELGDSSVAAIVKDRFIAIATNRSDTTVPNRFTAIAPAKPSKSTKKKTCAIHPLIQVPNQLVGAPLGTDVTLICNVEASPKAINYWQREIGEMIISNERYSMTENESSMYAVQMTLVIQKLHKADMGGYKCISKNSIGDAEGTIRLYEMELQKKTKSAHRLNSVEDTSVNDEINSTPNIDQPEENNKIHKNGRLYKGLQSSEHNVMSSGAVGSSHQLFHPFHLHHRPHQSSGGWSGGAKLLIVLLVHLHQLLIRLVKLLFGTVRRSLCFCRIIFRSWTGDSSPVLLYSSV